MLYSYHRLEELALNVGCDLVFELPGSVRWPGAEGNKSAAH